MSEKVEKYTRAKPAVSFNLERKQQFLDLFRNDPDLGGRKALCAEAVGVTLGTVTSHIRSDPEFGQAYDECHQAWIDENLFTSALKRACEGVEEPIMGGKYKDEIVATITKYSDPLLLALLKAHRPEFKDSTKGQIAGGAPAGGVMVVPSSPINMEEWQDNYGELAKGRTGRPEGDTDE